MRLPATRALSRQLKISRNTVKIAYMNLMSQGYLQSKGTAGTYVCTKLPDAAINALVDTGSAGAEPVGHRPMRVFRRPVEAGGLSPVTAFDFGLRKVDQTIAPERTWRRLLLKHLPYRSRHAANMHPAGLDVLREAIANSVSPLRGMSIYPENSLIVSDDYRAFDIICSVIVRRGASIAVENPCDAGLAFLLRNRGATILPIPVDDDGIVVDRILAKTIQAVVVSPTHQQPTGVTMSKERRKQLLDWANDTGGHIVEWDTFGEFCYDDSPLPSLFSADNSDRVIYVNSFSTWIGAGLQLGYVVAPSGLFSQFVAVKEFLDPQTSWLDQRVTADFVSSDSFFGHLRRVRQTCKQRRDAMISAIANHMGPQNLSGQQAGRHLVWHLPRSLPSSLELQVQAAAAGIRIPTFYDGFCLMEPSEDHHKSASSLLIGYTALTEEAANEGMQRLADVWGLRTSTPAAAKWSAPFLG